MNIKLFGKFLSSLFLIKASTVSAQPSYLLASGDQDRERLTILNELYNPISLPLLKIAPGMKILTIGCGIGLLELEIAKITGPKGAVLATDISAEQLKLAEKKRLDANLENLQFLQIDATEIAQIPGQFDRIHCRLVLTHLPWEKVQLIVPVLYSKLNAGGLLVMEECSSLNAISCEPFDPGFEKFRTVLQKQITYQKSDPSPGKRLYQYLKDNGYSVSYSSHQPRLNSQREKTIFAMGLRSAAPKLLQDQLISSQEIEEILASLNELENNPTVLLRYHELTQIIVQRPDE